MLDHLQGLVVILHNDVPTTEVCVELLEAEAHQQTLPLNIGIVSLYIGEDFSGKGNGLATLAEDGT